MPATHDIAGIEGGGPVDPSLVAAESMELGLPRPAFPERTARAHRP